eukprot:5235846-Amphidinium_carterae.1
MSDDDDDDESLMMLDPKLINRGFCEPPQQPPKFSEETLVYFGRVQKSLLCGYGREVLRVPKFLGNRPFGVFRAWDFGSLRNAAWRLSKPQHSNHHPRKSL